MPRVAEVVEIPASSACPFPEKAKREPLTPEETAVLEVLTDFQAQLQIAGTILPSTVRRVMMFGEFADTLLVCPSSKGGCMV
jgi:hypothetical protein